MKKLLITLGFTMFLMGCGEYDKNGFNKEGFNKLGFNKEGFNKFGFDKDGFDKGGFNGNGLNIYGITKDSKVVGVEEMLYLVRGVCDSDYYTDIIQNELRYTYSRKTDFETEKEYRIRVKNELANHNKELRDKLDKRVVAFVSVEQGMRYNLKKERWEISKVRDIGWATSDMGVKDEGAFIYFNNPIVFYEPKELAKLRGSLVVKIKYVATSKGIKKPLGSEYVETKKYKIDREYMGVVLQHYIKLNVLGYMLYDSRTGEDLVTVIDKKS